MSGFGTWQHGGSRPSGFGGTWVVRSHTSSRVARCRARSGESSANGIAEGVGVAWVWACGPGPAGSLASSGAWPPKRANGRSAKRFLLGKWHGLPAVREISAIDRSWPNGRRPPPSDSLTDAVGHADAPARTARQPARPLPPSNRRAAGRPASCRHQLESTSRASRCTPTASPRGSRTSRSGERTCSTGLAARPCAAATRRSPRCTTSSPPTRPAAARLRSTPTPPP